MKECDLLIIGGGIAGLTAGLFGARYGMHTIVVEKLMTGSQIINVESIENYPGFPEGISGAELSPIIQQQAMFVGAEFVFDEIENLVQSNGFKMATGTMDRYKAKTVIIATGSNLKKLNISGEEKYLGRGVSHCASCDGPLYMKQEVAVIGTGDSGLEEALTLTEYTSKIYLICKGEKLTGQKHLQDKLRKHPSVEVLFNTEVTAILGEEAMTGFKTKNTKTNFENEFSAKGIFIYVGLSPQSGIFQGFLKMDKTGHINVDLSLQTSVAGVYAAGDVREQSSSQLIASSGDGATAAISAFRYVSGN